MADSPNTDNYTLGKGVVYFDQLVSGVYQGERDLGNAPSFTFNIALEKLEHFSSRGGLKAKDKEIISQITPGLAFTLDEINEENIALLTLASITSMTQLAGAALAETIVAHLGRRTELAFRSLTHWVLPYDGFGSGGSGFVVGETIEGAGGATGVIVGMATEGAAAGTLYIARTNTTAFVDGEAITDSGVGSATVASLTGGTQAVAGSTPVVLVTDSTGVTVYDATTDYVITGSDVGGGRIFFPATSSITEGESLRITYQYLAATYTSLAAFANTQIIGKLRFASDNPAGNNMELKVWSVSLMPSGDTALIGDDWSTLSFTGEILKDETGHPTNPYMEIVMTE